MAFLGINVKWDTESDALKFMADHQIPYAEVRDTSGSAARAYGVEATPTTYIIGRDGRVLASTVGELNPAGLDRVIEVALGQS